MYKKITPFFLVCETPLHAGSGNDLGVVDLPIQRERHTSFPKIESSSLKGSLREAFESNPAVDRKQIHLAFGYDDDERDESVKEHFRDFKQFQGALGFTNARLLLFPVKSMKGVFAWITCPKVLEQLKRDLSLEGVVVPDCELVALLNSGASVVESGKCLVSSEAMVVNLQENVASNKKIILEEYAFTAELDETYCMKLAECLAKWLFKEPSTSDQDYFSFWRAKLSNNLVILPDDDFIDFVNLSTEVITRTKIDNEKGTVKEGALFTEEYLPAESVLYSLAFSGPVFQDDERKKTFFESATKNDGESQSDYETRVVTEFFTGNLPPVVQIGGNATLGKGLVRTVK